mmetsp:Transcript_26212/g.62075  ORF Transcript_26212/g.62075 Transcript_26212/m.62075 type:complete len:200 (+) Transcript_26212:204-803(+)
MSWSSAFRTSSLMASSRSRRSFSFSFTAWTSFSMLSASVSTLIRSLSASRRASLALETSFSYALFISSNCFFRSEKYCSRASVCSLARLNARWNSSSRARPDATCDSSSRRVCSLRLSCPCRSTTCVDACFCSVSISRTDFIDAFLSSSSSFFVRSNSSWLILILASISATLLFRRDTSFSFMDPVNGAVDTFVASWAG